MRVINFSDARNHLKRVLDQVVNDVQDTDDSVVISLEQSNGLMETIHLLKSPTNSLHLEKSIKQYRSGKIGNYGNM